MAVVTFWSSGKEETGKTLSIAAIATQMAIEHNYKILIISTGYKNNVLDRCFFQEKKKKKNFGLFGPNTNISLEEGITGLAKAMKSNKLSSDTITNYTKLVFKDRLEILQSFQGEKSEYEETKKLYPDIINLANSYYDLVLVDLDVEISKDITNIILENSNIVVTNLTQRLLSISRYMEIREEMPIFKTGKNLILIGRYDKYSKYTIKNISRFLGEKNKVSTIPYNTLFFESSEEAGIPDYFLRLRRVDEDDRNYFFISEVKRTAENIIYRLQDLQMKM